MSWAIVRPTKVFTMCKQKNFFLSQFFLFAQTDWGCFERFVLLWMGILVWCRSKTSMPKKCVSFQFHELTPKHESSWNGMFYSLMSSYSSTRSNVIKQWNCIFSHVCRSILDSNLFLQQFERETRARGECSGSRGFRFERATSLTFSLL